MKELDADKKRRTVILVVVAAVVVIALIVALTVLLRSRSEPQAQPTQPVETSATTSPSTTTTTTTSAAPTTPAPSTSTSEAPSTSPSATDSPSATGSSEAAVPTADPAISKSFKAVDSACNKGTQFNSDPSQEAMLVEDGGRSLTVMSGAQSDMSVFECVADKIALPSEVRQSIESKQSQPDERSANWDGMTATWTFNPNTGLDLYITAQQ